MRDTYVSFVNRPTSRAMHRVSRDESMDIHVDFNGRHVMCDLRRTSAGILPASRRKARQLYLASSAGACETVWTRIAIPYLSSGG